MSTESTPQQAEATKNITHIIYALYAASLISGSVTGIVAIIINYVKRDEVAGTIYESHFRWQIRTFWFSLLWFILGGITVWFLIGFAILAVAGIWYIYRIVKGWLYLAESKPMYT
ncbi:MAG TPA: hypothetical protein VK624_16040 [Steroidobacteraceae bacterium]|nr:hypothetical protein [Steroidobacteraceae bacterium]